MKTILYLFIALLALVKVQAQNVTITPGGITPAMSGTYPRLSYEAILALPNPQTGDQAFDITYNCMRFYIQGKWLCSYQDLQNYAPNMLAIVSEGGTNLDYGQDIALDASGNIYITGYFSGTTIFGGTSIPSKGSRDIFVAKYNKSGTLQWVQTPGGTNDNSARSIALDGNGNIYITGEYSGSATFGATTIYSNGSSDIFLAKYNNNGIVQWVQSAGGLLAEVSSSIAVDGSGNAYITGSYSGTATFAGTTLTTQGGTDIFVAKYNTSGSLQWVKSAGGTGNDSGFGIALDNNANVHITGNYEATAQFEATSHDSKGFTDIFIAKYNNIGSLQWVRSAGGTSSDEGNDIAIDGSGNVFITGNYIGLASFGINTLSAQGGYEVFVAKYNASGTYQWARSLGGTENDFGEDIVVENDGTVYITGYFYGTAFPIPRTSRGASDIFVAKFDSDANFEWVQSAGGLNQDSGSGITVDLNGNVYAVGGYNGTSSFGRNTKTSKGLHDIFVVMLDK
ncbi:SBBP repeat-containing protein [Emticicia sp. C21]|uniref:SBBP repeat-containing protein n=1 Tax=Emticicia sp. C21 TaxID=2302915 RepID=UPI000E35196D|nr:SBBP repeat-containing protein [Emticicia sp. C21]RFS13320.1 hypothetical protein D0T08_27145 [Emticicia sp. C21]